MSKFLFIVLLFTAGCASNQQTSDEQGMAVQNYTADSLTLLEKNNQKREAVFLLKGFLPNPAYSIRRIVVKRRGDTFTITPEIDYDPNKIVIQVAVPFEKAVTLRGLEGKCNIDVGGKRILENFSLD